VNPEAFGPLNISRCGGIKTAGTFF
jgi:hypothetical protein